MFFRNEGLSSIPPTRNLMFLYDSLYCQKRCCASLAVCSSVVLHCRHSKISAELRFTEDVALKGSPRGWRVVGQQCIQVSRGRLCTSCTPNHTRVSGFLGWWRFLQIRHELDDDLLLVGRGLRGGKSGTSGVFEDACP